MLSPHCLPTCSRASACVKLYHVALETSDDADNPLGDIGAQAAVREFSNELASILDDLTGAGVPNAGYYPPNSDQLLWETKGKVVRLDVAVYAVHLACARIYFKPMVHLERVNLEKLKETAVTLAAVGTTFALLSGAIGFIVRIIIDLFHVWSLIGQQQLLEKSIRTNMLKVMKDVKDDTLAQKSKLKKTRSVSSRHPTKQ